MTNWNDRNKWKKDLGRYKVVCDRSGFPFYNDQVSLDDKNRVIAKQYTDNPHLSEYPIHWQLDEPANLPFKRPTYFPYTNTQLRQTWSQTHLRWSDLHRLWSSKV